MPALSATSAMMSGLTPAACANGVRATVRSGTAVCHGQREPHGDGDQHGGGDGGRRRRDSPRRDAGARREPGVRADVGGQVGQAEGDPHEQQERPVDLPLERRAVEHLGREQEAEPAEREPGRIDAVPRLRDPAGQDGERDQRRDPLVPRGRARASRAGRGGGVARTGVAPPDGSARRSTPARRRGSPPRARGPPGATRATTPGPGSPPAAPARRADTSASRSGRASSPGRSP